MRKLLSFLFSVSCFGIVYFSWAMGPGSGLECLTSIFAILGALFFISGFIPEPSKEDYEKFANRLMDEYTQKAILDYVYAPHATFQMSAYSRERTDSDYHFGNVTLAALGALEMRIDDFKITVGNIPEPLWFFKSQAEVGHYMGIETIKIAHLYILRNEYTKQIKVFYSE